MQEYEDKLLKIAIDGVEMCLKVSGVAIKHIAVMIYAMMKENKRTKGKVASLTNLLKNTGGKIDIFSLNASKEEFRDKLAKELKKFGILYKMKVDTKTNAIDIIVPADQSERFVRACQKAGVEFNRSGIVETVEVRTKEADNDLNTIFEQAMPMQEYVSQQGVQVDKKKEAMGKKQKPTVENDFPSKTISKQKSSTTNDSRQTDLSKRVSVKDMIKECESELNGSGSTPTKNKQANENSLHKKPSKKKKSKSSKKKGAR